MVIRLDSSLVFLAVVFYEVSAYEFYDRIVGGQYALRRKFPAMVGLLEKSDSTLFCGGTVIHPQWIISACHCFFDSKLKTRTRFPGDVVVLAGTNSLDPDDPGGVRVGVAAIIIHPSFNVAMQYDVALLRLAQPLDLHAGVGVALVAARSAPDLSPVMVTGWGSTSSNGDGISTYLKQVLTQVQPNHDCSYNYGVYLGDPHYQFLSNQVCGGKVGIGNEDSCKGDSGGPMWALTTNGELLLHGTLSYGGSYQVPCGSPTLWGIYSRIPAFISYIEGATNITLQLAQPQIGNNASFPIGTDNPPGTYESSVSLAVAVLAASLVVAVLLVAMGTYFLWWRRQQRKRGSIMPAKEPEPIKPPLEKIAALAASGIADAKASSSSLLNVLHSFKRRIPSSLLGSQPALASQPALDSSLRSYGTLGLGSSATALPVPRSAMQSHGTLRTKPRADSLSGQRIKETKPGMPRAAFQSAHTLSNPSAHASYGTLSNPTAGDVVLTTPGVPRAAHRSSDTLGTSLLVNAPTHSTPTLTRSPVRPFSSVSGISELDEDDADVDDVDEY